MIIGCGTGSRPTRVPFFKYSKISFSLLTSLKSLHITDKDFNLKDFKTRIQVVRKNKSFRISIEKNGLSIIKWVYENDYREYRRKKTQTQIQYHTHTESLSINLQKSICSLSDKDRHSKDTCKIQCMHVSEQ